MKPFTLITLITIISCASIKFSHSNLINAISKSRLDSIEKEFPDKYRINYTPYLKYTKKMHAKLFEHLKKDFQIQIDSVPRFKLMDGFEIDDHHHVGLLWSDFFLIQYYYKVKTNEIKLIQLNLDLSDYPKYCNITLDMFNYYNDLENVDDLLEDKIPVRGMSGGYQFFYSDIAQKDQEMMYAKSYVYSD